MRQLEALLFDVDGTLADTERDGHRVAFNRAFAEAGLGWNWSVETYGRLLAVTGGKERIRHFLETEDPPLPAIVDLDGFIAELHREKTRYYTDALSRGAIPLRTGVARLLQEARSAGLQLGIATTTTPANVTALLRYGLGPEALDWFGVIAAGDVVPAKKPAPDIYEYAMASLGLQPEVCAAFEDSVHGLHAARDAGIDTVIVAVNDYTREQDFSGASLVLDSLGDPGVPCHRLAGGDMVAEYLDLATVRRIHHGTAET